MLLCGTRITAEYSAPFERVSLSFSWNIYESKGGALLHPHRGCSGHWPPSFLHVFGTPTLSDILSGGSTDALLSREVIGGVLLQSVWCVLLGVISTTCGFLLVIQTLCACYTGWGNVHGDAVGCPPYTPSFLRAGGERRGGDFV